MKSDWNITAKQVFSSILSWVIFLAPLFLLWSYFNIEEADNNKPGSTSIRLKVFTTHSNNKLVEKEWSLYADLYTYGRPTSTPDGKYYCGGCNRIKIVITGCHEGEGRIAFMSLDDTSPQFSRWDDRRSGLVDIIAARACKTRFLPALGIMKYMM